MQIANINSNGASATTSWEGGITEFTFSGTFGGAVCRIEYSINNGESWSEAFPRNPEHLFESTSDSKTVKVPAGKIRVWTEKASDTTSLNLDIKSTPTDLNDVLPSQTIKAVGDTLIIGNGADKVHELPVLGAVELIHPQHRWGQNSSHGKIHWNDFRTIHFDDDVGTGQEYIYWLEGWLGVTGGVALSQDHRLNVEFSVATDYGTPASAQAVGVRQETFIRSAGVDGADSCWGTHWDIWLQASDDHPYDTGSTCLAKFNHDNYDQTDPIIEVSFKGYIKFRRTAVITAFPNPSIQFRFNGETLGGGNVWFRESLINMQRIK